MLLVGIDQRESLVGGCVEFLLILRRYTTFMGSSSGVDNTTFLVHCHRVRSSCELMYMHFSLRFYCLVSSTIFTNLVLNFSLLNWRFSPHLFVMLDRALLF